jgi:hypothetical protein
MAPTRGCAAGRISMLTRGTNLRYAFRRHYRVKPWTDRMEIYWGKHSQGYATAVSNEEVCVAVASRKILSFAWKNLYPRFPNSMPGFTALR